MTPFEFKFVLWAIGVLLSIIAFVGVIFVNSFIQMAKDISEIKKIIAVQAEKHESLEKRVDHLETLTMAK